MKRVIQHRKTVTPLDIRDNKNIRKIKDGEVAGMSEIIEGYKKCDGRTSLNNEQFQKIKVQEICNIWNSSSESTVIQCNVHGGENIKFFDKYGEIIQAQSLNGYYTFIVTHQPSKRKVEFDLIITTPGECYEPRQFHEHRQYICFVENHKAFLSDDDTSGFYARIKTFLKRKGLVL